MSSSPESLKVLDKTLRFLRDIYGTDKALRFASYGAKLMGTYGLNHVRRCLCRVGGAVCCDKDVIEVLITSSTERSADGARVHESLKIANKVWAKPSTH